MGTNHPGILTNGLAHQQSDLCDLGLQKSYTNLQVVEHVFSLGVTSCSLDVSDNKNLGNVQ